MPFVLDMHMHTVLGAYDSSLKPEDLAAEANRVGLSGVNITEHDRLWDRHTLSTFRAAQAPLFINNGMEVSTDMGHIIAVGLTEYFPGIQRLAELRRVADETGAIQVSTAGSVPCGKRVSRRVIAMVMVERPRILPMQ